MKKIEILKGIFSDTARDSTLRFLLLTVMFSSLLFQGGTYASTISSYPYNDCNSVNMSSEMMKADEKLKHLKSEIAFLEKLQKNLDAKESLSEKLQLLSSEQRVQDFLRESPLLRSFFEGLGACEEWVLKSVLVIGQGPQVFAGLEALDNLQEKLNALLGTLLETEKFYDTLGGIVGYHLAVLRLIVEEESGKEFVKDDALYTKPYGFDLIEHSPEVSAAVRKGIEALPFMGLMCPIGGAGDRLSLVDEDTGEALPAALLNFQGHSLLAGIIRDLQACEYLHYKLHGKQLRTPVALMTSEEKNNHKHVVSLCEESNWFGKGREQFKFFVQGLVPVISVDGNWLSHAPLDLILKPGGHGVIWKEAEDAGVFEWFNSLGRKKLLLRQINNPMAGTDDALLAFLGKGFSEDKDFGFASCRRLVNTPTGVNVFCAKKRDGIYHCCITNIEYTEFAKKGIDDSPIKPGSRYAALPANTNILFADIQQVRRHIAECPIPGMIINMKSCFKSLQLDGSYAKVRGGRLESTMQNIADMIVDRFEEMPETNENVSLKTFLTYNSRRKTISVTKSSYMPGKPLVGTPLGCLCDLLHNYHDLLTNHCGMVIPDIPGEDEYLASGPSFFVNLHPSIGPSWNIIRQKIRGGALEQGAEMQLEIAEVDIENIKVKGSLLVEAENPMGHFDEQGVLQYSNLSPKCTLKNVTINNHGMNRHGNNNYWQNAIERTESVRIILHGNAEFHAEDLVFDGEHIIEVHDGYRVVARQTGEGVTFEKTKIKKPTWWWHYSYGDDNVVILKK